VSDPRRLENAKVGDIAEDDRPASPQLLLDRVRVQLDERVADLLPVELLGDPPADGPEAPENDVGEVTVG